MDITLPLEKMTAEDKLRVMESIWADLSRNEADVPSPDWHGHVLREREERLKSGQEQFMDWEEAKKQLRGRLS
jgi:hypothetical protein